MKWTLLIGFYSDLLFWGGSPGPPPGDPENPHFFFVFFLLVFLSQNVSFEHILVPGRPGALLEVPGGGSQAIFALNWHF